MLLTCGCCGAAFRGPPDPKHDTGFGECKGCTKWIAERDEDQWVKLTAKLAGALNEKNREKFLGYELGVQRGLLLEMIDRGLIKWEVSRG